MAQALLGTSEPLGHRVQTLGLAPRNMTNTKEGLADRQFNTEE